MPARDAPRPPLDPVSASGIVLSRRSAPNGVNAPNCQSTENSGARNRHAGASASVLFPVPGTPAGNTVRGEQRRRVE
ncbi:hypothetical protein [Actinosynnema sp. NPDC020468]|uniref:hypothetical protein n=1 Tax=Actinosynnema sp. NPDC020468 TaxID=3154488 RepID=UPI0034077DA3